MLEKYLPENPRVRSVVVATAIAALSAVLLFLLAPGTPGPPRGTPMAVVFQGAVYGLVLSLFGVGLVLIYRAMRFINFAQGAMGTMGATLTTYILTFSPLPFWLAILLGLVVSVATGAVVGVFLLRFFNSSRLFITVVTIVGSGVVFAGAGLIGRMPFWPPGNQISTDQQRDLLSLANDVPFQGFEFQVGSFDQTFGYGPLYAIQVAIVALVGIAIFLNYTRTGTAVRAMAENPERASLLGVSVGAMTIVVWCIAGALDFAAATAVSAAAPDVPRSLLALLIPFAAAILARFQRVWTTVAISVLLGVFQFAWDFSFRSDQGVFELLLFVLVCAGLIFQRRAGGRSEGGAAVSWAGNDEPRPVPTELRPLPPVRVMRYGGGLLFFGFLLVYGITASDGQRVDAAFLAAFGIAALSLVILTGWAGQVSLGQWSLAGVGAIVGGAASGTFSFWLALPIAAAVTAVVAVIVGLPALRIPGLFLLVSTFIFGVAVTNLAFDERYMGWLLPDDAVDRPRLFVIDFADERNMYYLAVALLFLSVLVLRNLRSSRFGRMLIAMRENEANVRSFGISPFRAKLTAFAVSGAFAGLAGGLHAHIALGVDASSFNFQQNVLLFQAVVVGGASSAAGAIVGVLYFDVAQALASGNAIAAFFLANGGPLMIIFLAPGGLISLFNAARDQVLRIIAQRYRVIVPSMIADYDPDTADRQLIPLGEADLDSGLSAVAPDERFTMASVLYEGKGQRVRDKVNPKKKGREAAAFSAAAASAERLDDDEFEADAVDTPVGETADAVADPTRDLAAPTADRDGDLATVAADPTSEATP